MKKEKTLDAEAQEKKKKIHPMNGRMKKKNRHQRKKKKKRREGVSFEILDHIYAVQREEVR